MHVFMYVCMYVCMYVLCMYVFRCPCANVHLNPPEVMPMLSCIVGVL